jgi:hypothetical protein
VAKACAEQFSPMKQFLVVVLPDGKVVYPKGNGPDIKEDPAKGFSPAFCRCLAPCARLRMTTSEKELDLARTSTPTEHEDDEDDEDDWRSRRPHRKNP